MKAPAWGKEQQFAVTAQKNNCLLNYLDGTPFTYYMTENLACKVISSYQVDRLAMSAGNYLTWTKRPAEGMPLFLTINSM